MDVPTRHTTRTCRLLSVTFCAAIKPGTAAGSLRDFRNRLPPGAESFRVRTVSAATPKNGRVGAVSVVAPSVVLPRYCAIRAELLNVPDLNVVIRAAARKSPGTLTESAAKLMPAEMIELSTAK